MPGYEYNPLTKLDLQKKSAVSPSDIQHLVQEIASISEDITDINGDLKNKVPKFFTSIDELAIGEIGEYQGVTNETFVNGFFYKRGTGDYVFDYVASREDVFNLAITNTISEKFYAYWQNYENSNYIETPVIQSNSVNTISSIGVRAGDKTFSVFLMPADVVTINGIAINDDYNIFYDPLPNIYNRGNLAPFAVSSDNKWYDIKFESGSIYVKIDGSWVLASGYGRGTPRFGWNIYRTNYQYGKCVDCFLLALSGGDLLFAYNDDNIIDLATIDQSVYAVYNNRIVGWTPKNDTSLQVYSYSRILSPSSQRVDTQPSLDPADFATAVQGAKADTALQGITHGTDGLYVTTTVTQKVSKEQTIYTSLTLQDVETADDTHQGVAEASNVRNFFNVIAAESEAYGVMWDTANPSPTLTRIGNMRNHALLPVQSLIVGGVLADDGSFTAFDNQDDWTQASQARDGSDGQVMVQLPQHWRRREKSGTYNVVMISPVAIPGYVEVRQQYVSAYEASLQHSTSKLCSVNNADADYRGGQNEASWDGTYRTLLNRPISNYNLAEFRTFARNRANGTKWNCLTYEAVRAIYWLFVTEYATLNSQADFNSALDSNGFHQGGLGIGVSDWTGDAWNAYNGYAPLIPCGILDEYGSGTAIKNFSIYNADTTLAHTFSCNKYRGIEMPFAHIWKYVDGVLLNVESGNGVSTVYATTEPANFSSTSFANYANICNSYRVDSYIKDIVFNKEGDIFATVANGSSTSYYCDQYFGANITSATELRAWQFGGTAHRGAQCGLACSHSHRGVGSRSRNFGSRLCFNP